MNTNAELDRIVKDFLEDRVAAPPRPDVLRDAIKTTSVTPQARRRFLGRWLDRDEGAGRRTTEHDPPPNTNRRTRLMLSATGIAAVIAIIAVASNVFEADPTVPGQAGTTHVVAADGSADFETIQAAVDAAAEGDTVVLEPGRYTEAVVIDKTITLTGDGPREETVIVAPPGPESVTDWLEETERSHGLLLQGSDATIADLTVEVPLNATGIGAMGGDPLFERISVVIAGPPVPESDWYNSYYAMGFYGIGEPIVRDSEWNGYTAVRDGAAVVFEGNTVSIDGLSIDGPGASVVRGNTFLDGGSVNSTGATVTVEGNDFTGGNFSADTQSVVEVRDNVFRGYETSSYFDAAIVIREMGSHATIENNMVVDGGGGISLLEGATGSIRGNTLEASRVGIQLGLGSGSMVQDNTITGEGAGILIGRGSDAEVTGNDIDVGARGIAISGGSSPTVSGNDVCGATESIWVADGATPELSDNQLC